MQVTRRGRRGSSSGDGPSTSAVSTRPTKRKAPARSGKGKGKAVKTTRQVPDDEESESDEGENTMDVVEDSSDWSEAEGEQQPGPSVRPMGAMPCVPRTEHVDDTLRRKIRRGEFVDFKSLIPHPRGEKPRKRFSIADGLLEEVEDTTNLILYNWIDAFVVFMSVTLEFFPSYAQGMLRHFQVVKRMHAAGKDGVDYDFQFRRLKCQIKSIQWGEYLPELAGEVREAKTVKKTRGGAPSHLGKDKQQPCFKFNSSSGCRFGLNCRFKHLCTKCSSSDHPSYRCSRK